MSKIIAVTGATGAQGGSIAYKLLETKQWHVRAITRKPDSDAAKALAAAGAEIVVADMNDEASITTAFEGAYAAFAVTNYWEHHFTGSSLHEAGEKEVKQAMNLARAAAKTSTIEHYLWSTLMPAEEMTDGKFPVPHLDYKAKVDDLIRKELPSLAKKTTFVIFGFYPSNMIYFPMLVPVALPGGAKYIWIMPCKPSTLLPSTGDMKINPGLWARQILAHPEKTRGKYITVATEAFTVEQILKAWSEVSGKDAIFLEVTPEQFESMWGLTGKEMAAQLKMNEAVQDWEVFRKSDFVKPQDIGIGSEAVGVKGAFESFKDRLIWSS